MMHRSAVRLCCTLAFILPATAHAQDRRSESLGPISSISSEWLQLNNRSMSRDGSPSMATTIGHDFANVRFELGYLRAARDLSSAKGVTAGFSVPLSYRRLTVRPGASMLVGQAQVTRDDGGYYYLTPSGQAAYQPRMLYSRGRTVGAIATLGAELRLGAGVSATASIREAAFSGDLLDHDRTRSLAGFGLSIRPGSLLAALHLRASASNTGNQP